MGVEEALAVNKRELPTCAAKRVAAAVRVILASAMRRSYAGRRETHQ